MRIIVQLKLHGCLTHSLDRYGFGRKHRCAQAAAPLLSYGSVFPGGWEEALYIWLAGSKKKTRRTLGSSLIVSCAPWKGRERERATFQHYQLFKLASLQNSTFILWQISHLRDRSTHKSNSWFFRAIDHRLIIISWIFTQENKYFANLIVVSCYRFINAHV